MSDKVIEAIVRVGEQRFGPWTVDGVTYATSGHCIVWAPVVPETLKPPPGLPWQRYIGQPAALSRMSLYGLPEVVCRNCNNHPDRVYTCDTCDGDREAECNLGHWHDCPDCEDGRQKCIPCDLGLHGPDTRDVEVLGRQFSDHLLSLALAHIKAASFTKVNVGDLGQGAEYAPGGNPVTFWVDGYGATVMPRGRTA